MVRRVSQSVSQSVSTADPWRDKETMRLVYQAGGGGGRGGGVGGCGRAKNGVKRREREREGGMTNRFSAFASIFIPPTISYGCSNAIWITGKRRA